MTKAYLKFPRKPITFVSRRFPQVPFMSVAYKTDGDGKGADGDKPDERTQEELLEAIQKRFDKSLEGIATPAELEQIRKEQSEFMRDVPVEELRELLDKKNGVMQMIARQGLEMQRMATKMEKMSSRGEDMSLRAQIERWMDKNKDEIKTAISKRQGMPQMEIRVDSPMFVSTVNTGGSPYIGNFTVESGINDFVRVQPTFWDYIKKGRTKFETIAWVNKTTPLGAADFIGPGELKPGVSFRLASSTSTAKKIADSAQCGTELLRDIDGMKSFIEDELIYQIKIRLNQAVLTDVADSEKINGIQTLSVAFPATGSGIHTPSPNQMDAIRAGVGYMRSGLLEGPITVFINPIDSTNMDMAKSGSNGVYLLPPFASSNGKTIGGATIVENTHIPAGSVQFAFLNYYRILIYQDLFVDWGWIDDNFIKNLVTAIGEMRIHQIFNSIYTGAFMFDTFANIEAAIDEGVGA